MGSGSGSSGCFWELPCAAGSVVGGVGSFGAVGVVGIVMPEGFPAVEGDACSGIAG